jgi:hypothetical protein
MSGSVEDDLQEVKQRLVDSKQRIPAVDDLRQFLKLVRAEVFRCVRLQRFYARPTLQLGQTGSAGKGQAVLNSSRSAQQTAWLQST